MVCNNPNYLLCYDLLCQIIIITRISLSRPWKLLRPCSIPGVRNVVDLWVILNFYWALRAISYEQTELESYKCRNNFSEISTGWNRPAGHTLPTPAQYLLRLWTIFRMCNIKNYVTVNDMYVLVLLIWNIVCFWFKNETRILLHYLFSFILCKLSWHVLEVN